MASLLTPDRRPDHNPALAIFAAVGTIWVFVLVSLGAFTTSIGAGMIFPDWPLSNGSINPQGWLSDISKFAEHSHRLTAWVMGGVTAVLAWWIWKTDTRPWLRKLAWFAAGLVLAQGIVGGLRVLLDPKNVDALNISLGRLIAMLHAVLAQLFVCTLLAIAVACTRGWRERSVPVSARLRRVGLVCCALLFLQLAIAAIMRHSGAGLAIRWFPYSTADGHWLPADWDFRVAIHFAHRAMAAVLAVALTFFAFVIRRDRGSSLAMRAGASAVVSLMVLQILLGMEIIRTYRKADVTTAHVLIGALTLATVFWLTWVAHRDRIEAPNR